MWLVIFACGELIDWIGQLIFVGRYPPLLDD